MPALLTAGPSSPIHKTSRLPLLNVASRSTEPGSTSPGAMAALRLTSPLGKRLSPIGMRRRGGSSLASVRLAAKAAATAGAPTGPAFSDQALRLPSPFQMAPSLAAKRERARSRWPSQRALEQTGEEADQGSGHEPRETMLRKSSRVRRSFEEVHTESHELLIVHDAPPTEFKQTTGSRTGPVRPLKLPPPPATLSAQPSMSSISSDSMSAMDENSPVEEHSSSTGWGLARRVLARPTSLPLPEKRLSYQPPFIDATMARGTVSEPVSRRASPPRMPIHRSLPRAASHSRIPRPRPVGARTPVHPDDTAGPMPQVGSNSIATRRRLYGEETCLEQPPTLLAPRREVHSNRGLPDTQRPLPKPPGHLAPMPRQAVPGRPMEIAMDMTQFDDCATPDGPVYRSARSTAHPSTVSSRATSPLRASEAASRGTSPIRELGFDSDRHVGSPICEPRPRVQTVSISTQTIGAASAGESTQTPLCLAPVPSRVASPDIDFMDVSHPQLMAVSTNTKVASKPIKGLSPVTRHRSQKPSPRLRQRHQAAQHHAAQERPRSSGAAPSHSTGEALAPMVGSKLSDTASSMIELLRVDLEKPGAVDTAEAAAAKGLSLLTELRGFARTLVPKDDPWAPGEGAMLCRVWQQLRPRGTTGNCARLRHSLTGAPASVDIAAIARGDPGRVVQLREAADSLCGLLRLSLCDAADLELAQSVLVDAGAFFDALRHHAATSSTPLPDAWRSLANPS